MSRLLLSIRKSNTIEVYFGCCIGDTLFIFTFNRGTGVPYIFSPLKMALNLTSQFTSKFILIVLMKVDVDGHPIVIETFLPF